MWQDISDPCEVPCNLNLLSWVLLYLFLAFQCEKALTIVLSSHPSSHYHFNKSQLYLSAEVLTAAWRNQLQHSSVPLAMFFILLWASFICASVKQTILQCVLLKASGQNKQSWDKREDLYIDLIKVVRTLEAEGQQGRHITCLCSNIMIIFFLTGCIFEYTFVNHC